MIYSIHLGLKNRETQLCLLFKVPDKQRNTLYPIIEKHVQNGSKIISDKFSSYINPRTNQSFLNENGYEHYFINHSQSYVNPVINWIHTNQIENTWKCLKNSLSKYKLSVKEDLVDEYLYNFMFHQGLNHEEFINYVLDLFGNYSDNL